MGVAKGRISQIERGKDAGSPRVEGEQDPYAATRPPPRDGCVCVVVKADEVAFLADSRSVVPALWKSPSAPTALQRNARTLPL